MTDQVFLDQIWSMAETTYSKGGSATHTQRTPLYDPQDVSSIKSFVASTSCPTRSVTNYHTVVLPERLRDAVRGAAAEIAQYHYNRGVLLSVSEYRAFRDFLVTHPKLMFYYLVHRGVSVEEMEAPSHV